MQPLKPRPKAQAQSPSPLKTNFRLLITIQTTLNHTDSSTLNHTDSSTLNQNHQWFLYTLALFSLWWYDYRKQDKSTCIDFSTNNFVFMSEAMLAGTYELFQELPLLQVASHHPAPAAKKWAGLTWQKGGRPGAEHSGISCSVSLAPQGSSLFMTDVFQAQVAHKGGCMASRGGADGCMASRGWEEKLWSYFFLLGRPDIHGFIWWCTLYQHLSS